MTNQHPIVPSPEQVDQWFDDAVRLNSTPKYYIARQAALWSADQELEACCEWVYDSEYCQSHAFLHLRTGRRPKPPSLKEQALAELDRIPTHDNEGLTWGVDVFIIRKALEALPND